METGVCYVGNEVRRGSEVPSLTERDPRQHSPALVLDFAVECGELGEALVNLVGALVCGDPRRPTATNTRRKRHGVAGGVIAGDTAKLTVQSKP